MIFHPRHFIKRQRQKLRMMLRLYQELKRLDTTVEQLVGVVENLQSAIHYDRRKYVQTLNDAADEIKRMSFFKIEMVTRENERLKGQIAMLHDHQHPSRKTEKTEEPARSIAKLVVTPEEWP